MAVALDTGIADALKNAIHSAAHEAEKRLTKVPVWCVEQCASGRRFREKQQNVPCVRVALEWNGNDMHG